VGRRHAGRLHRHPAGALLRRGREGEAGDARLVEAAARPNTERCSTSSTPTRFSWFGVATDICDDAPVHALLRRGRRIAFVEDAARGVDESRVATCTAAWRDAGVRFTTAEEAAASLG